VFRKFDTKKQGKLINKSETLRNRKYFENKGYKYYIRINSDEEVDESTNVAFASTDEITPIEVSDPPYELEDSIDPPDSSYISVVNDGNFNEPGSGMDSRVTVTFGKPVGTTHYRTDEFGFQMPYTQWETPRYETIDYTLRDNLDLDS